MLQSNRAKLLLSLGAGALLPLAFAPFDFSFLAFLCLAGLFVGLRNATPRSALLTTFGFGITSFLGGTYWTFISVHEFGGAPLALSALAMLGLVFVLAMFAALAAWLFVRWLPTQGLQGWLGTLPAMWVLAEWGRGWMLTGFGWLSVGYSQTDTWLMSWAPVLGLHGVSYAVALTAGAGLAVVLCRGRQRWVAASVIVVIWGGAWLVDGWRWTSPKGDLVSVALAQGAITQDKKWQPDQYQPTLDLYRQLSLQAAGSDLILWPEVAIPNVYAGVQDYLQGVQQSLQPSGSTAVLGILYRGQGSREPQNAVVALTDPPQFYVKRHLVPFGEYFPVPQFAREWLRLLDLPYTDLRSGVPDQPLLEVGGELVAVTICYEDVFGAEQLPFFPAASLIVNVSNDAWFGDSISADQHLQIARMRAAEVGRYVLRSTNTGISAVIDPYGRIVKRAPQFEPALLTDTVQGFTGSTPYVSWGNYPVIIFAFIVLVLQLATTKFTMRPGT